MQRHETEDFSLSDNAAGGYKAAFRGATDTQKRAFSNLTPIMPISVGNKVQEGTKFVATLQLLSEFFPRIVLLIDDTIQRYSMAMLQSGTPDGLRDEARHKGDLWLSRHFNLLESYDEQVELIRWDNLLLDPNFNSCYKTIEKKLTECPNYHDAIESSAYEYIGRVARRHYIDMESSFELCMSYLKEECAAMLLWSKHADLEIYPSDRNSAMGATNKLILDGKMPHFGLRFYRNNTVAELKKSHDYEFLCEGVNCCF